MAILVTGASAGFGEAMCRTFAQAGYFVIGAARRGEKLQALAAELGERFYPLEMDVSRTESIRNALDSLPENFAEIDCLINNAGLALGLETADKADCARGCNSPSPPTTTTLRLAAQQQAFVRSGIFPRNADSSPKRWQPAFAGA